MIKLAFQPHQFLPNLLSGLISGLVTLTFALSYATLIFSGTLAPYLPLGISSALLGAGLTAIVVALRSSFPFAIAGPDTHASAILAVMAGAIANSLSASSQTSQLLPTLWATLVLSTVLTGFFLLLLGQFRLGRWIRFVPYPVMGGFLAGTGWLITRGSFEVLTGVPLQFTQLFR